MANEPTYVFPDGLEPDAEYETEECPKPTRDCSLVTVESSAIEQSIIDSKLEAIIDPNINIVDGLVIDNIEVIIEQNSIMLAQDNIFISDNRQTIEPWLKETIDETVERSSVIQRLKDFEDKMHEDKRHIYKAVGEYDSEREHMAYEIEHLKRQTEHQLAAIGKLQSTVLSPEAARSISEENMSAWVNGVGKSWANKLATNIVSTEVGLLAQKLETIGATAKSDNRKIAAVYGDIQTLKKQADGVIETHKVFVSPVSKECQRKLEVSNKPYSDWLEADEVSNHVGDMILLFEKKVDEPDVLISTYKFVIDTEAESGYSFALIEDHFSALAFARAERAEHYADNKTNSYYQPIAPTKESTGDSLGEGDIWTNSNRTDSVYIYKSHEWILAKEVTTEGCIEKEEIVSVSDTSTDEEEECDKLTMKNISASIYSVTSKMFNRISGFVIQTTKRSSRFSIFGRSFNIQMKRDTAFNKTMMTMTQKKEDESHGIFRAIMTFDTLNGVHHRSPVLDGLDAGTSRISGGLIETEVASIHALTADIAEIRNQLDAHKVSAKYLEADMLTVKWIDYSQITRGELTDWQEHTTPPSNESPFAKDSNGLALRDAQGFFRLITTVRTINGNHAHEEFNLGKETVVELPLYPYNAYLTNNTNKLYSQYGRFKASGIVAETESRNNVHLMIPDIMKCGLEIRIFNGTSWSQKVSAHRIEHYGLDRYEIDLGHYVSRDKHGKYSMDSMEDSSSNNDVWIQLDDFEVRFNTKMIIGMRECVDCDTNVGFSEQGLIDCSGFTVPPRNGIHAAKSSFFTPRKMEMNVEVRRDGAAYSYGLDGNNSAIRFEIISTYGTITKTKVPLYDIIR